MMAIYHHKETELEEAFEFLKSGLEKNEVIMLITDDCQKMKLVKKLALNGMYLQTLEKAHG